MVTSSRPTKAGWTFAPNGPIWGDPLLMVLCRLPRRSVCVPIEPHESQFARSDTNHRADSVRCYMGAGWSDLVGAGSPLSSVPVGWLWRFQRVPPQPHTPDLVGCWSADAGGRLKRSGLGLVPSGGCARVGCPGGSRVANSDLGIDSISAGSTA